MKQHIIHPIPAYYDNGSRILILGSFPSVKSREQMFFYGHPRNRFWKVIAQVFGDEVPKSISDKKAFLSKYHIALWDVIGACDIEGSSDASIENVIANDLSKILDRSDIKGIFVNGRTAEKYYIKYTEKEVHKKAVCLPSTSPANAAWSLERLVTVWSEEIQKCLGS
ncbi:MAG: DNA-deoxyinosine glycosylase [Lachnospiraceae bacterium]|nr:DNA-deoxyinosine glycosylase [Lachnospiraceae bacterium]